MATLMSLIDVMSCKHFDSPHKHGTDRTLIHGENGTSLGPRFFICPFDCLRAKDAMRHILKPTPKPIRIVTPEPRS